MKRGALGVLAVALIAFGAVAVSAQSGGARLTVKIPFDFSMGDGVLPAAQYTVEAAGVHNNLLVLTGPHGSRFITANAIDNQAGTAADKLVFHHVGDQYFLASIWTSGNSRGYELSRSGSERELMAQGEKSGQKVLFASAR
jgi:hypothetical protein